jgi:hypothetical protein
MSAKGVGLESRTSGRPIPIEIKRFAAGRRSQPHALEARVAAAVHDKYGRTRRSLLDLRDKAAGADDPSAVEIFDCQRRADLVVPGRDVERFILVDVGGAVRRAD